MTRPRHEPREAADQRQTPGLGSRPRALRCCGFYRHSNRVIVPDLPRVLGIRCQVIGCRSVKIGRVLPRPRVLLAVGLLIWAVLVFAAPGILFPVGQFICHQRPERSFFIGGQQLPVCARCTGLYLGAALAIPFGLAAAVVASTRHNRRIIIVAALPTLITWTLEFAGIMPFSNAVRFACALPLGFTASWLVLSITDNR